MIRALTPRSSRSARPCTPSDDAHERCVELILAQWEQLTSREGRAPCLPQYAVRHVSAASAGKGPGVTVTERNSDAGPRAKHLLSLKTRTIHSRDDSVGFLSGTEPTEMRPCHGRLIANGFYSTAGNGAIPDRRETQGAGIQTTRHNTTVVGQAAASQVVAVAVSTALAKQQLRERHKLTVANPMSSLPFAAGMHVTRPEERLLTGTSRLLFNACPVKLSCNSVTHAAQLLATTELQQNAISVRIGTGSRAMLRMICQAITSPADARFDAVWASIVLVVYLCSHPCGRDMLSRLRPELTDLDLQIARTIENYGRTEIMRRVRHHGLDMHGLEQEDSGDVIVDMMQHSQRVLSTKRKRGVRGPAASISSDGHGLLHWWCEALSCEHVSVLMSLVAYSKRAACDAARATLERQSGEFSGSILNNVVISRLSEENAVCSREAFVPVMTVARSAVVAGLVWQYDGLKCASVSRVQHEAMHTLVHACVAPRLPAARPPCATKLFVVWSVASLRLAPRAEDEHLLPGVVERLREAQRRCNLSGPGSAPPRAQRMIDRAFENTSKAHTTALSGLTRSVISFRMRRLVTPEQQVAGRQLAEEVGEAAAATSRVHSTSTQAATTLLQVTRNAERRREPTATPACRLVFGIVGNEETRTCLSGKTRKNSPCRAFAGVECIASAVKARHEAALDHYHHHHHASSSAAAASMPTAVVDDETEEVEEEKEDDRRDGSNASHRWRGGGQQPPSAEVPYVPASVGKEQQHPASSEPMPLLTIVDLEVECAPTAPDATDPATAVGELTHMPFDVAVHVCGDAAVRTPEALRVLQDAYDTQMRSVSASSVHALRLLQVRETAGLLLVAASQSSYIGNVGAVLGAGYTNTAIAASKKVSVCDVTRQPLLTPFDTYPVGLSNLEPSFVNTAYVGAYGPGVDSGISPPGLHAHNYISDNRQHGACMLSQEGADALAEAISKQHFVRTRDGTAFAERPISTRGVPHNLTMGVTSALEGCRQAVERVRRLLGRADEPTVGCVLSLPFGPFSQTLAPFVDHQADVTLQTCVRNTSAASVITGTAHLVDATHESEAIVREPLFPRPALCSVADNPFQTSYEAVDSVFNAASTLVLLARCRLYGVDADKATSPMRLESLHTRMSEMIVQNRRMRLYTVAWLCMAGVLINSIYTSTWGVDEPCLLTAWATALPAVGRAMRCEPAIEWVNLDGLVNVEPLKRLRVWWAAFCRKDAERCAWNAGLLPLLLLIDEHDGSHDVSLAKYAEMRTALETAVRAAWLVHSPDGIAPPAPPCPAASAADWTQVDRTHVEPVYVGDAAKKTPPYGTLVGMKPHQYRQLLVLMLAAIDVEQEQRGGCEAVRVQVFRNEGGLSLRVSSAADILAMDGKERSIKSISPVSNDMEGTGFGAREDKVYSCGLQRSAWDHNTKLLTPVFATLVPPRSSAERLKGASANVVLQSVGQRKRRRTAAEVAASLQTCRDVRNPESDSSIAQSKIRAMSAVAVATPITAPTAATPTSTGADTTSSQ